MIRFCIITVPHFLMQLHIYSALYDAENYDCDEAGAESLATKETCR